MEKPEVSVIISNSHPKGVLLPHIYSLLHQTISKDRYEIFFPNYQHLSAEESSMLVFFEETFPHFHLPHSEKGNRTKALNFAAEQAKGKWLLFTESHCLMPPELLEKYLQFLEKNTFLCVRGVYKVLPTDSLSAKAEGWLRHSSFPPECLDLHDSAIERKLFWKRGGFDETFLHIPEFVFGAKYYDEGGKIGSFSECIVWHKEEHLFNEYMKGVLENGREQMKIFLREGVDLASKYFPNPVVRYYTFMKFFRLALLPAPFLLSSLGRLGFFLANLINAESVGFYFFRLAAKNTHRTGLLKGMVSCSSKKSDVMYATSSS
ncbi:MAG: hypothetical protein K940chlam9_00255 [Chlamydiae bacterium]|nr:hypothetical protein [Chlamydiota bacterium]